MKQLDGAVVLVSGGARGIGAALARLAASEGAFVVVGDVLEAEGRAVCEVLGGECRFVRLDVCSEADWAVAVETARDLGPLRGLVNSAGVYLPLPMMETDVACFERHVQVNQLGVFLGMRAVVPAMREAGGGSIVNLSSTAGLKGSPGAFAYSATKWAVRGMTKSAALDLARYGIRVNSIHPGPVDTPMLDVRTEAQKRERLDAVPLRRMARAEEIAQLAAYLLSPESGYITGAEMAADGGASL